MSSPMDNHVREYFTERSEEREGGNFHKVIQLDKEQVADWEMLKQLYPQLPRGWYELSQLDSTDRVEFTREYWLSALPYQPHNHAELAGFFSRLDDIAVFITQASFDSPFEVQCAYSLKDNSGFFRGFAPAAEEAILALQSAFPETILPKDYLAFLRIHDGFSKYLDTGMIGVNQVRPVYDQFQAFLDQNPPLLDKNNEAINPRQLLPFYESFGLHCYQCFMGEWYPEEEMGNVYYSGIDKTLSETSGARSSAESLAFATFLDWLVFYLEGID